jgi:hypothetical protein
MGERSPIPRVAAKILNKQMRTADKEWSFSFGVGRSANKFLAYIITMLRTISQSLGFEFNLGNTY